MGDGGVVMQGAKVGGVDGRWIGWGSGFVFVGDDFHGFGFVLGDFHLGLFGLLLGAVVDDVEDMNDEGGVVVAVVACSTTEESDTVGVGSHFGGEDVLKAVAVVHVILFEHTVGAEVEVVAGADVVGAVDFGFGPFVKHGLHGSSDDILAGEVTSFFFGDFAVPEEVVD